MKPSPLVADEMFPEAGRYLSFEMVTDNIEDVAGGSGPIMIDVCGDEKVVHADFPNDFGDLNDDDDMD